MKIYNDFNIPNLVNDIYDGVDFSNITADAAINLLDLSYQAIKYSLSNNRLEEIKEQDDPDMFGIYTSNWFKARRYNDMLDVIGYRQAIEMPGDDEDYDKWILEGYITYKDFTNHFQLIYKQFKQQFDEYETAEWDLRLNIVGSYVKEQLLIDSNVIDSWASEGVALTHYGFNELGNPIAYTDTLINSQLDIEDAVTDKFDNRFKIEELSQTLTREINDLLDV
ncbi:MAG: hypothetical protein R6V17_00085 [Halanaerobacter sp.]